MRDLAAELAALRAAGLYRAPRTVDSAQGPVIASGGREWLNFCSNDYLGLAADARIAQALATAAARRGCGSGAAHLVCGHSAEHAALEEELAAFTGRPRALLFSTGYLANLGVLAALAGRGDSVLEDRLNHASLLDGGRLSGARLSRYAHADAEALEAKLAVAGGERIVVTDGVFSMDGDVAPLPALADACRRHAAWLVVDDAHGFGALGPQGRGSLALHGLDAEAVPVVIGTLGKAFGTSGALVAGSAELIEYLIQKARPYIYTTASSPALAAATRASLRIVQAEDWRRERLTALIARFRAGAAQLGFGARLLPSTTPIQPIVIGAAEDALAAAQRLADRGIWVTAIRPPTVPAGSARLRVTLSAAHTDAQLDRLLDALAAALPAPA